MRVTSLELSNVRAIEAVEFRFQPGFNLIVGVNGVGKTTVLHALRVGLSPIVKRANKHRSVAWRFAVDDIRVRANLLTVECAVRMEGTEFRYFYSRSRDEIAIRAAKAGSPRKQTLDTPGKATFLGEPPQRTDEMRVGGRPLAVLFSTLRSRWHAQAPNKWAAGGGPTAAFSGALSRRVLRLGELEEWMRSQIALRPTRALAGQALDALEIAVSRFLPGYSNLRPHGAEEHQLLIDRDGITVSVTQMSSGERGVLALVLDLTRRLVQANPEMNDPVAESEAVVLIDELDLHLHPKWQRQIVGKLTATFPRCQFIATSHSPQVVASVDPEQVHLMVPGRVIRPDRSRGMDSNWILRHLMEADDRPMDAKAILKSVERSIEEGAFADARAEISEAKRRGFDLPEWSILEARIARLEILAE